MIDNNLKSPGSDGNSSADSVIVENVGPVMQASIPAQPGRITVLKGANGSGKSHLLGAVKAFSTGQNKKDVPLRDGAKKGRVEFGGARLTIGKVNRSSGEADIAAIEGKFSIEDLVDPGLQKDEAADAKSIKALIGLLCPEVSFSLFAGLLDPGEVDEIISSAARETDDLVKMASHIKRDIEKAARRVESELENHEQNVALMSKSIEGIDLEKESDAELLQENIEKAMQTLSDLRSKKQRADEYREEAAEARTKLVEVEENYSGLTVEQAENDVKQKRETIEQQKHMIEKVERNLRELNADLKSYEGDLVDAESNLETVRSYEQSTTGWRAVIEKAEKTIAPTDDEIEEAEMALDVARHAHDQGVRIRDAKKKQREIDAEVADIKRLRSRAEQLRDAAKATDDVLSDVISKSGSPLQVATINGETRLVLKTDRGDEYFRDLSEGERWKISLDIAIDALQDVPAHHRILVIGQTAWEALDDKNRNLIREHIAKSNIWALTAEASREGDPDELMPAVL